MNRARESANVVNVERSTGESLKPIDDPIDWESVLKGPDRVGVAGKGNAKSGNPEGETPRKSDRKDLIESETQDRREAPGGKPERVSTKEASVP
ncbi:hypothetical protein GCM10027073_06290 [Streptomyces chlorus]